MCPTDPAVPRENCPGHPRQGVPNHVGPLSIKVMLSSPLVSSLSRQKPFFPIPCISFCLLWVLGRKALAWQLHTGGLCFSLGEQEQVLQCVLSHWSLVQTYFKACGSQQGSYVLLLIFTSIWSTLSKSTQWDLYRVINIPQLSGLPLPCSKSSYHSLAVSDTPGYYVLLFPRLNSLLLFVGKKEKFSFAWTLAHLLIKLILVSMFTWGSELSDRWLKERISSEQGIALLKSRGNVVILIPFQHSVVTTGSVLVSFMLSQLHTWPNQVSLLKGLGCILCLDAPESVAIFLQFSVRWGKSCVFSLYLELSIKSNSRNKEKIQSSQFYPNFYRLLWNHKDQ